MDFSAHNELLHLNMAGSGRVSESVLRTVIAYHEMEQRLGPYETEQIHQDVLESEVYNSVAELLGCAQDAVALFDNATRAWTEIVGRVPLEKGKVIITTPYEYAGNLQLLRFLATQSDLELKVIPIDEKGIWIWNG